MRLSNVEVEQFGMVGLLTCAVEAGALCLGRAREILRECHRKSM